jgi:hypothetical protein
MAISAAIPLHEDTLRGAKAIALFLYGNQAQRRKVYHLASRGRGPFFREGSRLCIRRSEWLNWVSEMETQWKAGRRPPPRS